MPKGPFSPSQFVPTEWSTAADKAKFGNTLLRFLDADCPRELFTKKFCTRLSMTLPDESESRHGLRLWLVLAIEHILEPLGYKLNGDVSWTADEDDDRGTIFVKDNAVETIDDVIFNEGPSWAPEHYVDDRLKKVLHELVDSADNAGCTPDLTVVSAKPVEAIRQALARI